MWTGTRWCAWPYLTMWSTRLRVNITLAGAHNTPYGVNNTLLSVKSTLQSVNIRLPSVHSTLAGVNNTLPSVNSTRCQVHVDVDGDEVVYMAWQGEEVL